MHTEQNRTEEHPIHVWNFFDLLKLWAVLGVVSGLIALLFPQYEWLKTFALLSAAIMWSVMAFGLIMLFWDFFKWLAQLFKQAINK